MLELNKKSTFTMCFFVLIFQNKIHEVRSLIFNKGALIRQSKLGVCDFSMKNI